MAYPNKQYELIAGVIDDQRLTALATFRDGTTSQAVALATVEQLAERMADRLQAAHRGPYSFKRDRFMKACGFE